MGSDASNFINNRTVSITQKRIKGILSYVCECYKACKTDKANNPYSISVETKNSTIHFEDFLKFELIDNYLNPNKTLFQNKISELEEIHFAPETQERYLDDDNREKPDKIDIYINKLGLQNEWKTKNNNIYFAIECKRIQKLSDAREYVGDIEKMTKRNYKNLRLPFEGQLAFIENPKLNYITISAKVNEVLKKNGIITTNKYLTPEKLHSSIDSTYNSEHLKNFDEKSPFWVYHLLLDYSQIVVN